MSESIKKIIIILLVILAFGQTVNFYFWKDDFALVYKLQHIEESPDSFGPGPFGTGPYKYLATPFIPIYKIFGTNPQFYFIYSVISYIVTSLTFYFFAKRLFTKHKNLAFIAACFFATSYVSSESMHRVINSVQNNIGVTLALISMSFYLSERYLYSLIFFFLSCEFVFIRSHSLFFVFPLLEFIIIVKQINIRVVFRSILKMVPFAAVFYFMYIHGNSQTSSNLVPFITKIISGEVELLATHFATLANIYFPDIFISKAIPYLKHRPILIVTIFFVSTLTYLSWKKYKKVSHLLLITLSFVPAFLLHKYYVGQDLYWYRDTLSIVTGYIGLLTTLSVFLIFLMHKNKEGAKVVLFSLFLIISQIIGYNANNPYTIYKTSERYLVHSLIGYSLLLPALSLVLKHKLFNLLLVALFFSNLLINVHVQRNLVKERGWSTENFYKNFTSFVKTIKKPTLVYIDVAKDSRSRTQFSNYFSVGTMPNMTAIAIHYGVTPYHIYQPDNFDEVSYMIKHDFVTVEDIRSFFYKDNVLIDTTDTVQENLSGKGETYKLSEISQIKPVSPLLMRIRGRFTVSENGTFKSPDEKDYDNYIEYQLSKHEYYETSKINSTSSWRASEIERALDNNIDTAWWGNRLSWHDTRHEEVVIDLGKPQFVDTFKWVNWTSTLTPISYSLHGSNNKVDWVLLKNVSDGVEKKPGEITLDKFESSNIRYVKMVINKTVNDDAPSIAEIEVIQKKFNSVDVNAIVDFNLIDNKQIIQRSAPILKAKFKFLTNDEAGYKVVEFPIKSFDRSNEYEIIIPPSGTALVNFEIETPSKNIHFEEEQGTISPLSFSELEKRGLIKNLTGLEKY